MKSILRILIKFLNSIFFRFLGHNISIAKTSFYFVKYKSDKANHTYFNHSEIEKTTINISGKNNLMEVNNALISDTTISITGNNNQLIIKKEVKLRGAIVHIRGNNCNIKIGEGTTFGGIRIVNVGTNNDIFIGENCLFADFIELWASDTHSIYDSEDILLNPEQPVIIGNDVWVGSHVIILKGVTIEDGAIVGMNTLVTKNVARKTLNVGNPMRCVKEDITWSLKYKKE
jgi:acetyltransferase-like isoleucine patch superfamily enzyme